MDREETATLSILESTWLRGADFLVNFHARSDGGVFFHPVRQESSLPEDVQPGVVLPVIVRFREPDVTFRVHAHVLQRLSEPVAGLWLRFLPEEKAREDLVVGCARGNEFPYVQRRHDRVPCVLPVRIQVTGGEGLDATALNISERGIYLATTQAVAQGSIVELWLPVANKLTPLLLRGRVASIITTGPHHGIGVEFIFGSAAQQAELAEQVTILRRQHQTK